MEAQPKCNLIIDSCCDLPFEVIDRPGVQLLEFPYIDEKGEHSDDLYRTITPHEFYEGMRAGSQPSTAQVPVTVFHDVFSKAIESGVPTVYLSCTSGLSGSFNTAVMMRDQLIAEHPEAELYVVDTYLASVAEALLVYEALNQRDNGMTARELAAWAEEARYFVDAEFMVDDLESLRRPHPQHRCLRGCEARCEAAAQHQHRGQACADGRGARAQEGHQAAGRVLLEAHNRSNAGPLRGHR